jgi:hypothetical protein
MRLGFIAGGGIAFVGGIATMQASRVEPTSGDLATSVALLVGGVALVTVACLLVSLGACTPRGDLA